MMFPGHAQNPGDCAFTSSLSEEPGNPKVTGAMSAKGASISQVMMIVLLAAANMAILRHSEGDFHVPLYLGLDGDDRLLGPLEADPEAIDESLPLYIHDRLRDCVRRHGVLADTGRINPLGLLVRWYQQLTGEETNAIALAGFVRFGEIWMAAFLSFILAWVIGLIAAWLERRRNWDIAAFFRGALVGFVIASLLAMIDGAVWGWVVESPGRFIGRWVLLAVCLILGGWMGLSKLRSSIPGRERGSGDSEVSP